MTPPLPSPPLIWTFVKSDLVPLVVFFLSRLLRGEVLSICPALWNLPLLTRAYQAPPPPPPSRGSDF